MQMIALNEDFMRRPIFLSLLIFSTVSMRAQYLVMSGDHPDPSVVKMYYAAHKKNGNWCVGMVRDQHIPGNGSTITLIKEELRGRNLSHLWQWSVFRPTH